MKKSGRAIRKATSRQCFTRDEKVFCADGMQDLEITKIKLLLQSEKTRRKQEVDNGDA